VNLEKTNKYMLRRIYLIVLLGLLSLGGGAWSVDYVLRHFDGFDRLKVGQWEAFPQSGTLAADPYARSRASILETIALGRSEGLVFTLWYDERGTRLRPACSYHLEGAIPEAGFFTLYAVDSERLPKKSTLGRPDEINSDNALRRPQGDYLITISSRPQPGNWLAVDLPSAADERVEPYYGLVLTLYDTPIITTTGMAQLAMPKLVQLGNQGGACD